MSVSRIASGWQQLRHNLRRNNTTMNISTDMLSTLKGATHYLFEAASIGFAAIEEERDEEIETLEQSELIDQLEGSFGCVGKRYLRDPTVEPSSESHTMPVKRGRLGVDNRLLEENMKKAAEVVVVDTTRKEYNR